MREKSNLLRAGVVVALALGAIWGAFSLRCVRLGIEAATLGVLFITLVAVVLYAHETHLLRLQHFRPYVLLLRFGDKKYQYLNAGNGAALNVRVTNAHPNRSGIAWDSVPYLGAGGQSHDMVFSGSLTGLLDPVSVAVVSGCPSKVTLKVAFDDVEGKSYETWMEYVGKDGEIANIVAKSRRR